MKAETKALLKQMREPEFLGQEEARKAIVQARKVLRKFRHQLNEWQEATSEALGAGDVHGIKGRIYPHKTTIDGLEDSTKEILAGMEKFLGAADIAEMTDELERSIEEIEKEDRKRKAVEKKAAAATDAVEET